MSMAPAKRRKTSPTTSVAVDASNTQSNPSTPKRASFQSPTKASLARSHPNLLPQSAEQSQVQTRAQDLRQELLSRRNLRSASKLPAAGPQTPKLGDQPDRNKPVNDAATGAESFSGAVRNLFIAEPSKLPVSSRTPLRTRQPPIRLVESQTESGRLQISKHAQPSHLRGRFRSNKDAENDEPELPATPVQLGLNEQPERPKGLSSSSPGRSSGSNRQRTRLNESKYTSSPSKLRDQVQIMADSVSSASHAAPAAVHTEVIPHEAPESDAEASAEEEEESSIPAAVLQKRSFRDSLSAQLVRIESEMASLEAALAPTEKDSSVPEDADPSLLALLTTTNPSCAEAILDNDPDRSPSPPVTNPMALGSKPLSYLTLFAPGNLQLQFTTSARVIQGKAHQIHVLQLLAPEPWPAHIFGATLLVTIDVEEQQVKEVEVKNIRPGMGQQGLRVWVKKRLEGGSGLHRLDVGGLVWGFGSWWETTVLRAKAWRRLEERFQDMDVNVRTKKSSQGMTEVLSEDDIRILLPHLGRTNMEFELGMTRRVTRSNKGNIDQKQALTKVMLLWDLSLDWTGEVDETVGVAVAGMGGLAEQAVKDVFGKMFKRTGVFLAMESVVDLLGKGTTKTSE